KVRSVVDSLNDKVQASKSPLDLAKALKSEADIAKDTSVQKAGDRVDTWIEDNCDSKGNTKN
ncbi:MAG: hypothetical protein JO291_09060, partial [Acidimicrobiia bacterium]|nr:hypothetical protein [Acidimicrobiia bacterium]